MFVKIGDVQPPLNMADGMHQGSNAEDRRDWQTRLPTGLTTLGDPSPMPPFDPDRPPSNADIRKGVKVVQRYRENLMLADLLGKFFFAHCVKRQAYRKGLAESGAAPPPKGRHDHAHPPESERNVCPLAETRRTGDTQGV